MAPLIEKLAERISDFRYSKKVENDPGFVIQISYPSEKLLTNALKADPTLYQGLTMNKINKKLSELAVELRPFNLKFVPDEFKSEQMCLEAVKQEGTLLDYVPEALQTADICIEAVVNDSKAFQYVKINDEQVNVAAINCEPRLILQMQNPSDDLKAGAAFLDYELISLLTLSQESYDALVENTYWYIKYIPEQSRTEQMCMTAYCEDKRMLEFFPEKYKTDELWLDAIADHPAMIKLISNPTTEMIVSALKQDGLLLKEVYPEMKKSTDIEASLNQYTLQKIAAEGLSGLNYILDKSVRDEFANKYNFSTLIDVIESNIDQINEELRGDNFSTIENLREQNVRLNELAKYIAIRESSVMRSPDMGNEYKQNPEFCNIAVMQNPAAIQYVHKPSEDLFAEMVKKYPDSILCDPNPSVELVNKVVPIRPSLIQYLDTSKISDQTYIQIVEKRPYDISYIPKNEQTPELCITAIEKSNGKDYRFIAPEKMTQELWTTTVKLNPNAIKDVPVQYLKTDMFPKLNNAEQSLLEVLTIGRATEKLISILTQEEEIKHGTYHSFIEKCTPDQQKLIYKMTDLAYSVNMKELDELANQIAIEFRKMDELKYEASVNENISNLTTGERIKFDRIIVGEAPLLVLKDLSSEATEALITKIDYNGDLSEAMSWYQASQKSLKEGDYGIADNYMANYNYFLKQYVDNQTRFSRDTMILSDISKSTSPLDIIQTITNHYYEDQHALESVLNRYGLKETLDNIYKLSDIIVAGSDPEIYHAKQELSLVVEKLSTATTDAISQLNAGLSTRGINQTLITDPEVQRSVNNLRSGLTGKEENSIDTSLLML